MSLPVICVLSCLAATPAASAPQEPGPVTLEDVIVTARRGATRFAPETELDPGQIADLGAYDIGEAIRRLGEGLGLDRPPILIVNGRRVVNPNDFLGFPPDALLRLEVLPQQATSTYGGDPSQRVVNLVLQPQFVSRDAQGSVTRPTAGGRTSATLDGRQSSIQDSDVSQYGVRLSKDTALRGAERAAYVEDNPGREGVTLRPAVEAVSVNATLRRALGDGSSAIGARAQRRSDRSAALVGGRIVDSRRRTDNLSLTGGLSGDVAGWSVRLGLEGQATRADADGLTDMQSRNLSATADLGANRTVVTLPAGPLTVNLTSRYGRFTSNVRTGVGETSRSIDTLDLGGTLSIPVTGSSTGRGEAPAFWGNTSITLGATLRETNDAGGRGLSAGLFWSPVPKLRLNSQWSTTTESPTAQQRLDPVVFGEPRLVFDFATGQAVEVLPLLGGNPDLRTSTTDLMSLALTAGPFTSWNVLGSLNLQRVNATDGIGALPTLTPDVEAAFPERFQRDENGRLIVIDQRPINLDTTRLDTLSSNLTFNLPTGTRATGSSGRGWRVGITHSWQLDNRVTLAAGLPELDRLAGDGGGVPRHALSLVVDGRVGRLGINTSARWRGASRIRRDLGRDGPADVMLEPLSTIDLKLSYLFAPGARLELEMDNLLDTRPQATLGEGRPAPGYGRDDQDPLGRTIQLTLSQRF